MKRLYVSTILALALACPILGHAQTTSKWYMGPDPYTDMRDPYQYRDVDNAQILQIVAYAMTPAGMVMEWGITRPLHYLATRTALAPLLSGDQDYFFFGETNNADLAPAGTFAPAPMNLSNSFVSAGPEPTTRLEESLIPPSRPGQPALH